MFNRKKKNLQLPGKLQHVNDLLSLLQMVQEDNVNYESAETK